jgi:hypothetical protein
MRYETFLMIYMRRNAAFARGIAAEPPKRTQCAKVMERIARREQKKNSTFFKSAVFFL